jgi:hypothetical protein
MLLAAGYMCTSHLCYIGRIDRDRNDLHHGPERKKTSDKVNGRLVCCEKATHPAEILKES